MSLVSHLEHLQNSLTESQMERREAKERSDTIIMHLTKQLEEKTVMLEDMRSRSIWTRVKTALGFECMEKSRLSHSPSTNASGHLRAMI